MTPALAPTETAILYTRVSTEDQADSGLGLADQAEKLRAMATVKGWQSIELTDDGVSGKSLNRPAMTEALRMLAVGEAHALVVSKLDRLTRSVADLAGLMELSKREGWALVILDLGIDTTTASGKLVANVMASVSEWERDVIGERTKAALAQKRSEGHRLGRPVVLPDAVRTRIASDKESGLSLRKIAEGLTADGVPTAQGGAKWHASTVSKVLKSIALDVELAAA